MNCPTCKIALLISERQGIEIDYCQQCRGVWLDRGELDKLIERASSTSPSHTTSMPAKEERKDERHHSSPHAGYSSGHKRERENPIAELFDFF